MKRFIAFAAAGLILVGCQNDELSVNNSDVPSINDHAISFSANDVKATRGSEVGAKAAELLGNNFIVYGFKYGKYGDATDEAADGTGDQKVFDLYNVNYTTGTANLTQSNTNDWEYVGEAPATGSEATTQSIKYWDYGVKGYVFSAVSGLDVTAQKVTNGTSVYDKGWKVSVPAGGSLVGLYASERVPVTNQWDNNTNKAWRYDNPVSLKFYSMATKVRFAMYETVPGYSIKINKFYYTESGTEKNSETNFIVDGKFNVLSSTNATATVTYYSDDDETQGIGTENHPKVVWDGAEVKSVYTFGANIQAQAEIGVTSSTATYDQTGAAYTYILPYQADDNTLTLKVDYTLTSIDGSGEQISVHGATATVPANYTQWKENFAYTYLFKISDKTNGSTTPGGPEGLYPITFDACVVTEEEGIQETVTSLGEPAITTYQKGTVVTVNEKYSADDSIYFSVTQAKALQDMSVNAKVYEVYDFAGGEITEALVSHFTENKVALVPVTKTEAPSVPLIDGNVLKFDAKQCYRFAPVVGKTYAIQFKYGDGKYAYKVVKVDGQDAGATFKLTTYQGTISEADGTATILLKSGSERVTGAVPAMKVYNSAGDDVTANFVITENTTNAYKLQLTPAAIAAGANDTYTVKVAETSCTFNVSLTYTFDPATKVSVIAGKTATFTLKVGTAAVVDATINNSYAGIKIEKTATDGEYQVTVAPTVAGSDYSVTIAGQAYKVSVKSYSFDPATINLVWAENAAAPTQAVALKVKDGDKALANVNSVTAYTSSNTAVFANGNTGADGTFTFTPLAGGKTTLTYENAACEVTVNKYELKGAPGSFKKSTGFSVVTLLCNDEAIVPTTTSAYVYKLDAASVYQFAEAGTYTLTNNGKSMIFGNVTKAGQYLINYYVGSVIVGSEVFTVTE